MMNPKQRGFTLLHMAIAVAILGIILSATFLGSDKSGLAQREQLATSQMVTINQAAKGYMAENGKLPCPAKLTVRRGDASFGIAQGADGVCDGVDFSSAAGWVAGGVPTTSLKISPSLAFADNGTRIMYVVAKQATSADTVTGCTAPNFLKGPIPVRSPAAASSSSSSGGGSGVGTDSVMALYVTYLTNVQGAYNSQGTQINTGDANNAANVFGAAAPPAYFTVSTPGQVVYVSANANDCCKGTTCPNPLAMASNLSTTANSSSSSSSSSPSSSSSSSSNSSSGSSSSDSSSSSSSLSSDSSSSSSSLSSSGGTGVGGGLFCQCTYETPVATTTQDCQTACADMGGSFVSFSDSSSSTSSASSSASSGGASGVCVCANIANACPAMPLSGWGIITSGCLQ